MNLRAIGEGGMMIGSVLGVVWGRGLGGTWFANSGGGVEGVRGLLDR